MSEDAHKALDEMLAPFDEIFAPENSMREYMDYLAQMRASCDTGKHDWHENNYGVTVCVHCGKRYSDYSSEVGLNPRPAPAPSTTMPAAHALFEEAEATISGPRRGDYGSASESFKRIALTWSAVLGVTVTAQQVALCMVGLKICREANGHKHDSLVDICGYTGLLAEMEAAKP